MRHDGPHDPINPHVDPDTGEVCFGCKIRSIRFDGSATPTARSSTAPARKPDPAWERGRAGETRADGSFMPYLDERHQAIGVKQMADNRGRYEAARAKQLAS